MKRSYRPWSLAASMKAWTSSGLDMWGISQEVERTVSYTHLTLPTTPYV